MSIAMATLVLVSLCAVCASPLSANAANPSSGNAQGPTRIVGSSVNSAVAVGCIDNYNQEFFMRGPDNALWWRWVHSSAFSGWSSLGGKLTSDPAVTCRHMDDGYTMIDVCARGGDGYLWEKFSWNGGANWSNWFRPAKLPITSDKQLLEGTGPAAYTWLDGSQNGFFITGTDHALWEMWFDSAGAHGWLNLGGYLTSSPAVASPTDRVVEVFAAGQSGGLWWKEYNNGWQSWKSLGGQLASGTAPAACSWGSWPQIRFDVFVQGTTGALWHKWYTGGAWSNWESLGGKLTSSPGAAAGRYASIDVYGRGGNGDIWVKSYGDGWWYSWSDMFAPPGGSILI